MRGKKIKILNFEALYQYRELSVLGGRVVTGPSGLNKQKIQILEFFRMSKFILATLIQSRI